MTVLLLLNRACLLVPFWGYVVEGFDNDGNFIFQDNNGSVNGVLTGKPDGKIDENDKTDIGNPHPDFTYGLNINVGYKNWDLTAFFPRNAR